jgi:acyl-homoserine lactone acylase PvdQ
MSESHGRGRQAVAASIAALVAFAVWLPSTAGAAPPEPGGYQEGDFLGFRNILPPGQSGFESLSDIIAFRANGTRPPHNDDQLGLYGDLVHAAPGLSEADVDHYFKDASFGVPPSDTTAQEYTPNCLIITPPSANSPHCDDVTIVRDSDFGVPHIYATDRAAAMFGSGYAAAEDRLFFMDVERHLARGQLASLLGGSNAATDRSIFASTPYTEADLQQQYDDLDDVLGSDGALGQQDIQNYVDGINQYIAEARVGPPVDQLGTMIPGEYSPLAINRPLGPDPWQVTDVVATASLVAGQFGKGGGNELGSAQVLQKAETRFGDDAGRAVWSDFREANDPEAPTTIHDQSFPYEVPPDNPQGLALPDPGTLQSEPIVPSSTKKVKPAVRPPFKGFTKQHTASNALLVSADESASGHPIAVMGPQVGYFAPQILTEQDIHAPTTEDEGPGVDARGVGFSGVSLYVLLGRGPDYAWSATSAGQDIIDTYAVHLCNPEGGGPATIDSDGYMFDGTCLPFEEVTREDSWTPNPQDPTPAGSQTLTALRTKLGIVTHRAMLNGEPVAYTSLRSTYFHELDGAAGFADLNSPERLTSVADFEDAANRIGYTFNWFYADDDNISYFNSGNNPIRPADVDPNFPVDAPASDSLAHAWQGYDPDNHSEDLMPQAQHPHVTNQDYLSSWNNKQAPDFRAADDAWSYGSVHRVDSLNERIEAGIAGSATMTRAELVDAMEDAGTVDLRGSQVLPSVLKVVSGGNKIKDETVRKALKALRQWRKDGAHRRDANDNGAYDQAKAVRIMDAWWPRLVKAEFRPALGGSLFDQIQAMIGLDDPPGAGGSAYISGWYGYVDKDLRTLLGESVDAPYSRVYCGDGKLGACRKALRNSLSAALKHKSDADLYPGGKCEIGTAQVCHDAVRHMAVGGIAQSPIEWINRPTFQQVVEVQGHRPPG